MSTSEIRLPWAEASELAVRLATPLLPLVAVGEDGKPRLRVAGSIRRRKPDVGDIEIVAEPRMVPAPPAEDLGDLFGGEAPSGPEMVPDLAGIRAVVASWGDKVLDGDRQMARRLPSGIRAELYLVHPWPMCEACGRYVDPGEHFAGGSVVLRTICCPWCGVPGRWRWAQWGSTLAVRTGPAELGKYAVTRLRELGRLHQGGHVEDLQGRLIPTPTEEAFFHACGLVCVEPERRAFEDARHPLEQRPAPLPAAAPDAAPARSATGTGPAARDVLLVDLGNVVSRAWFTLPQRTLGALGPKVLGMIRSALRRWPHSHLYVCEDADRSVVADVVSGYKEDRDGRDRPSTVELQDAVRPWLEAVGIAVRGAAAAEADHVIGALAGAAVAAGRSVTILSRDTDLLQLVSDDRDVRALWPSGGEGPETLLDEEGVRAQFATMKEVRAALPPALIAAMRVLGGGKDGLPKVGPPLVEGERRKGFSPARAAAVLLEAEASGYLGHRALDAVLSSTVALTAREASWLTPDAVASARARYDVVRLDRYDHLLRALPRGGHSLVARLVWDATPDRPAARAEEHPRENPTMTARCGGGCGKTIPLLEGDDPAAARCVMCKSLEPCGGGCGRMIPIDGSSPNHCNNCAIRYGRATAEWLRQGRGIPACTLCRKPMDLTALEHSEERVCTTCRAQQRVLQARGREAA